ncbi:MAG: DNA replication/repair protein RecF [Pseudomonadota bacterium]
MYVSKLKVYNFRNLIDQTVELHNGAIYITGRNGNGKTNLVEALYLLSGSRSFRTNSQSELVRWGKQEASVFGTVVTKAGSSELGIALTPGHRTAFKNGTELGSIADLMGACSVVAFSPSDLALVKGSPAGRRKFLDRHMVDLHPPYLSVLMAYQRALDSKSALLKTPGVEVQHLAAWNKLLAESAVKIVDNRYKFLKQLVEKSRPFHHQFAQSDGQLDIRLESDLLPQDKRPGDGVVVVESLEPEGINPGRFEQEFARVAPREIAQRSCVLGPHRDDVAITIGGIDARAYASQGQTRSVVLALKLGVIELLEERLGEPPIVVLDDVDSELDATRAEQLFLALSRHERQLFITGTSTPPATLAETSSSKVQVIELKEGVITDRSNPGAES